MGSTVEGVEAVETSSGIGGIAGDLINVLGLRSVVGAAVVVGSGRVFCMSMLRLGRDISPYVVSDPTSV